LFEYPLIVNFDGQFGQMQGIDKKHDGHAWWKVKMTNIKNDFNLIFQKNGVWVICNAKMKATIFFFLTYLKTK